MALHAEEEVDRDLGDPLAPPVECLAQRWREHGRVLRVLVLLEPVEQQVPVVFRVQLLDGVTHARPREVAHLAQPSSQAELLGEEGHGGGRPDEGNRQADVVDQGDQEVERDLAALRRLEEMLNLVDRQQAERVIARDEDQIPQEVVGRLLVADIHGEIARAEATIHLAEELPAEFNERTILRAFEVEIDEVIEVQGDAMIITMLDHLIVRAEDVPERLRLPVARVAVDEEPGGLARRRSPCQGPVGHRGGQRRVLLPEPRRERVAPGEATADLDPEALGGGQVDRKCLPVTLDRIEGQMDARLRLGVAELLPHVGVPRQHGDVIRGLDGRQGLDAGIALISGYLLLAVDGHL